MGMVLGKHRADTPEDSDRADDPDNPSPSRTDRRSRRRAKAKSTGPRLLRPEERRQLEHKKWSGNRVESWVADFKLKSDVRNRKTIVANSRRRLVSQSRGGVKPLPEGKRGLVGNLGGHAGPVAMPVEYRATTVQAAGMWPFPVGAGAPLVGIPLGSHLYTSAPVCFDPLSWMTRAKFLHQPSMMLLGLPGFGKSTLARKIMLGLIATGVTALVLGDMKPDYRKLVESIDGGQIIDLGNGAGQLNPLDMGPLSQILPTLDAAVTDRRDQADLAREHGRIELADQLTLSADKAATIARQVRARISGDRLRRIKSLSELTRGRRIEDFEEAALREALALCDEAGQRSGTQPELTDLIAILDDCPQPILDAYCETDRQACLLESKPLRRTLKSLLKGGFGDVFSGQTTTPINVDATAVCIDVSGIEASDRKLKGAVLLTCWEHGFAATAAAHFLHDAGCGPKRNFLAVLDEMWQVLRAGVGMVERVDELTRLNRVWGTALLMCTHTVTDLISLANEEDREIARGFIERAACLVVGALPRKEMSRLADIKPFTDTEVADITSWSSPPALTGDARTNTAPPGQGKFYIKVGEQGAPGLPLRSVLTTAEIEAGIHDTNQRFDLVDVWKQEYDVADADWAGAGAA